MIIEDLNNICSIFWDARSKWYHIGLGLNLKEGDLKAIDKTHNGNVEDCFTKMLSIWLRATSTCKLADLTASLKHPPVRLCKLAEEVEKKHLIQNTPNYDELDTPPTTQTSVHTEVKVESRTIECNSIIILIGAIVFLAVAILFALYLSNMYNISPKDCYTTGRGVEMAEIGERANAVVHIIDQRGNNYTSEVETMRCEITHKSTSNKVDCRAKKGSGNQYEISYQPTSRGRHQLYIKVEGEHIKGSPFNVTVIKKLGTLIIKTISGVKEPWGVAVNQRGEVLVAEKQGHCISIFSPTGEKRQSFGSKGSGQGQFREPRYLIVDDDGNILVTDSNHRVQTFSSEHKFLKSVGSRGGNRLEFNYPISVVISPTTKKIAVSDSFNDRVQILNPDLTFHSSIGSQGSGNGQLNRPYDAAFDSAGNIYVTDTLNRRIQVFNPDGKFLRQFGNKGKNNGGLKLPTGIYIDSDDIVYVVDHTCNNDCVVVFTQEGKRLTSFGSRGRGPGQFMGPHAITVDKNGIVYVADSDNNRIQIF